MPLYARNAGAWKDGTLSAKDANVIKPAVQAYAKDNGVWKPVFSSAGVTFQLLGTNLSRSGSINTGEASDTKSIVIFYVHGFNF